MSDDQTGMKKGLTRYGDDAFSLFLRKAFIKAMGYTDDALNRPIIGIADTFSGFNACHKTVPDLIEAVKRGVMLAGGLPVEFPTISIHESFAHPTSMFLRNLMSMDTEEMIRAQPMDAVVLIGGCDKTVPALLMGAASANVPAIVLVTGPMGTGSHKGERLGACTDCRRMWGKFRAGEIDEAEIEDISAKLVPTAGTCGVMGTASTMALMTEAMGMMLPGGAAIPAWASDRLRHAEETGTRAVALAKEKVTPDQIITQASLNNAMKTLLAIGGSTNAVIHLLAIAGRVGVDLTLDDWDRCGREVATIVNLMPSGKYLMEEFFYAGGLPVVLKRLGEAGLLHKDALTVSGTSIWDEVKGAVNTNEDVIRPVSNPLTAEGGIAVLKGNLAPKGAVIKPSAASAHLLKHRGRAVVFEDIDDYKAKINDEALDIDETCVMVLKNCGPKGYPGMAEVGNMGLPPKVLRKGITDMVRISDARMSGTAYGTVILHTAPEAADGGPLAVVRDGDMIELDVAARSIRIDLSDEDLAARLKDWKPNIEKASSGYAWLHQTHTNGADTGADLDFLIGCRGAPVGKDSH